MSLSDASDSKPLINPSKLVGDLIKPDNKIRARNVTYIDSRKDAVSMCAQLAILADIDETTENLPPGNYFPSLEYLRQSAYTVMKGALIEVQLDRNELTVGIPKESWLYEPKAKLLNNRIYDQYLTKIECGVIHYEVPLHVWERIMGNQVALGYGFAPDDLKPGLMELYNGTSGHPGQYQTLMVFIANSLFKRASRPALDKINNYMLVRLDQLSMQNQTEMLNVLNSLSRNHSHIEKCALWDLLCHLVSSMNDGHPKIRGANLVNLAPADQLSNFQLTKI